MDEHKLPDCLLAFWTDSLDWKDVITDGDLICEQGFADLHYTGINKIEARKVWRK